MKKVLNGITINYRYKYNENKDKIVLLLHGWGGSLNSFRFLEKYLLENNYSIITVDFPGFGASEKPKENFTINDYYIIIRDLLMAENVSKVNIVAHSFGGRIAIMLSANNPELVNKLVLVDSAGIKPKFSLKTWAKTNHYKFLKFLKNKKIIKKDLSRFGSEDYRALPQDMKQVFSQIVKTDLSDYAKQIKAETLIVWGDKDTSTPLYMARKLNKLIKNSGLIIFENAGHFCYLSDTKKFENIINIFIGD